MILLTKGLALFYKLWLHILLWHLHYEIARNREREMLVREAILFDLEKVKQVEMEIIQLA